MATHIRTKAGSPISIVDFGPNCFSQAENNPYGTFTGTFCLQNPTFADPNILFGKIIGFAGVVVFRYRLGVSIPLKAVYSPLDKFRLAMRLNTYVNNLESFSPQVFMSDTDDSGLYSTGFKGALNWESNLNNDLGLGAYGDLNFQYFEIDRAIIEPLFGGKASFVIGEDQELQGIGASSGTIGTGAAFKIQNFLEIFLEIYR